MRWKWMPAVVMGICLLCTVSASAIDYREVDSGLMEVSGAPDEVAKFHDIWQTRVWPDWKQHLHENKQLRDQVDYVKNEVPKTGRLTFYVKDKTLKAAFDYAVEQTRPIAVSMASPPQITQQPAQPVSPQTAASSPGSRASARASQRKASRQAQACQCGCGRRHCRCQRC